MPVSPGRNGSTGRCALAPPNCVPYDSCVFGHLLPRQTQLASNPERDEEQLRAVMMQMTPTALASSSTD